MKYQFWCVLLWKAKVYIGTIVTSQLFLVFFSNVHFGLFSALTSRCRQTYVVFVLLERPIIFFHCYKLHTLNTKRVMPHMTYLLKYWSQDACSFVSLKRPNNFSIKLYIAHVECTVFMYVSSVYIYFIYIASMYLVLLCMAMFR